MDVENPYLAGNYFRFLLTQVRVVKIKRTQMTTNAGVWWGGCWWDGGVC